MSTVKEMNRTQKIIEDLEARGLSFYYVIASDNNGIRVIGYDENGLVDSISQNIDTSLRPYVGCGKDAAINSFNL